MNPTSKAIIHTVLTTDGSLSAGEKGLIQRLVDGLIEDASENSPTPSVEVLLLTQKAAAKLLSVSRVTIWRLTRDKVLHPVEILPGTFRYHFREVAALAKGATASVQTVTSAPRRRLAA